MLRQAQAGGTGDAAKACLILLDPSSISFWRLATPARRHRARMRPLIVAGAISMTAAIILLSSPRMSRVPIARSLRSNKTRSVSIKGGYFSFSRRRQERGGAPQGRGARADFRAICRRPLSLSGVKLLVGFSRKPVATIPVCAPDPSRPMISSEPCKPTVAGTRAFKFSNGDSAGPMVAFWMMVGLSWLINVRVTVEADVLGLTR